MVDVVSAKTLNWDLYPYSSFHDNATDLLWGLTNIVCLVLNLMLPKHLYVQYT
jgi:hypothetical protein